MKIILTKEQLKKIEESTRVELNEARMPTYLEKRMLRSHARDIQNEFYAEYLLITKSLYKFNQFAELIHQKQYGPQNTWENDNQKRKMTVIYNELMRRLDDFGNKYLVKYNEENSESMNDVDEQIDTEDDEKELMSKWYGDDSFDEYGSLDGEDDEDNEDVELDFNYAPEYDVDSDDSYDLSRENDLTNRMGRSVRVGAAGAVDRDTKRYTIDGKEYSLTPIEYRNMLKDMGRITPEKAAIMGISVDNSGVIKTDKTTLESIKYLRKRITKLREKIDYYEEDIQRLSELGRRNGGLEHELEFLKNSLEYSMNRYDELTGNVDGEEYDF